MGSLPVKPGISPGSVTNIPEKWSAAWFRTFIKNHLQFADVRNASAGQGITIAGQPTEYASLAASGALAQIANNEVLGNVSGQTAPPVGLTAAQVTQLLQLFTSGTQGVVPASGGGTTNFLRADGTWAAAGGGGAQVRGATWTGGTAAQLTVTLANDVSILVPSSATINRCTILTKGGTGSCEIDIWKAPIGSYPPTVANSICPANHPIITAGIDHDDSTLTGFNTSVNAGDVLTFHLVATSTFTQITITLAMQ